MNRVKMRNYAFSKATLARGLLAGTVLASAMAGVGLTARRGEASVSRDQTTLRVVGFEVSPSEKGTPLDLAYQKFLATFQQAHAGIKVTSLPTPPDFDTKMLVDLAAGTAPDVWSQDASTLAPLVHGNYVLDMRKCTTAVPALNLTRFFPTVLAIHKGPDGSVYGLPNDFTPMMIYYNALDFKRANVPPPTADWTWNDLLKMAQKLTLDNKGRNRLDAAFDDKHVVQWGFRVRKYTFEWLYRLWENGSDVVSPNFKTATGYLDSPQSMQALQFMQDLVLKYKVAPTPSALDQMTQSVGFDDRFLKGDFAMFDRGHWELSGFKASKFYNPKAVAVVSQPKSKNHTTVIYESSWQIRGDLTGAKQTAACQFVEAATARQYQDTKVITGIAIAANKDAAAGAVSKAQLPAVEKVFIQEATNGRAPYGSKYYKWPTLEKRLDSMMERILANGSVKTETANAVKDINRELSRP